MYREESDKFKQFTDKKASMAKMEKDLRFEKRLLIGLFVFIGIVIVLGSVSAIVGFDKVKGVFFGDNSIFSGMSIKGMVVKSSANELDSQKFNTIKMTAAEIDLLKEEEELKSSLASKYLTEKNDAVKEALDDAKSDCNIEKASLQESMQKDIDKWKNKYENCGND